MKRLIVWAVVICVLLSAWSWKKQDSMTVNCNGTVSTVPMVKALDWSYAFGEIHRRIATPGGAPTFVEIYRLVRGTMAVIKLVAEQIEHGWKGEPEGEVATGIRRDVEAKKALMMASCCPTTIAPPPPPVAPPVGPPLDTVPRGNLAGPSLAADALRKAAPGDAKWLAQIPQGVAVARYESGFKPTAANSSNHVGLWQISGPNAAHLNLGDRTDPYANARYAYALWKGRGGSWAHDWTVYPTARAHVGEYARYAPKPAVTAAVQAGGAGVVPDPATQAATSTITTAPATSAADAIRAMGKRLGASPITPHLDPAGKPSFDLMSTGAVHDKIAEEIRTNHDAYGAEYVIASMRIASANSTPAWSWRPYHKLASADPNSDWRHVHHVHVTYKAGKVTASAPVDPTVSAPTEPGFACPQSSSGGGSLAGVPTATVTGTSVITWNAFHGSNFPNQSHTNDRRVVDAMVGFTKHANVIAIQELSDPDRKDAVNGALDRQNFAFVGKHTSHEEFYNRAVYDLLSDDTIGYYQRGDNIEGPDQGDRYIVVMVLKNKQTGQVETFVNQHQLPHIQKGDRLNPKEPHRIAVAIRGWKAMQSVVRSHASKGPVFVMGDMNFDGDPNGMYAAAGLNSYDTGAATLRKRTIDRILTTGNQPDAITELGKFGSDHTARLAVWH